MLRKAIAVFCALFAVFAISGTTFAATTSTTSIGAQIASLQKTCAVVNVSLHGAQAPTAACASTQKLQPQTNPDPNCTSGTTMVIFETNGDNVCFDGTGYLGYRVTDAEEVRINVNQGWFLWYYSGQSGFCNLIGKYSLIVFPSLLITQVDPGNTHVGPSCPPA